MVEYREMVVGLWWKVQVRRCISGRSLFGLMITCIPLFSSLAYLASSLRQGVSLTGRLRRERLWRLIHFYLINRQVRQDAKVRD
jgi:hypothetical protein